MKSKRLTLFVLFVVAAVANALACTNLIVGKNASADGSGCFGKWKAGNG